MYKKCEFSKLKTKLKNKIGKEILYHLNLKIGNYIINLKSGLIYLIKK